VEISERKKCPYTTFFPKPNTRAGKLSDKLYKQKGQENALIPKIMYDTFKDRLIEYNIFSSSDHVYSITNLLLTIHLFVTSMLGQKHY
jgi:hypothetical protein